MTEEPTTAHRPDGRRLRGERTRAAALDAVVALASVDGLSGVSLARLADELGVSKSGLFAHWRDKEQLQLDAVERARRMWIDEVCRPALAEPRGVRRLWAAHQARMDFYLAERLPGGCFFAAVLAEFGDRPGPVRDRITEAIAAWLAFLARLAAEAVAEGQLRPGTDVEQLAFEIDALGLAAVTNSRVMDRSVLTVRCRRAVLDRLRAHCTDPSLLQEEPA
ncbi:TetR/AcrR family transcriptional regulator [Allonocardiopsis opalescens]|uniref:TetR family transcriptional regulator n=1 Tax=Allonocardiopsis opalescens TaxID=1144618 RepID=A0A2T0PXY6_9ACTN|nr:TetR/AcrR family transcriptional regulator [Allonocardiopsis opalescens]PRX96318.1 TetR family transcriptional regulator [Allonocardiopsis opalescens]